jgi:hypothetical protein
MIAYRHGALKPVTGDIVSAQSGLMESVIEHKPENKPENKLAEFADLNPPVANSPDATHPDKSESQRMVESSETMRALKEKGTGGKKQ